MSNGLPSVEEIFEELAGKVRAQIDKNAPVSFDRALSELISYHNFLIELHTYLTPEGDDVENIATARLKFLGQTANEAWLSQYTGLYKSAVNMLPLDDHYLRELASIPRKLLSRRMRRSRNAAIELSILRLMPHMIHIVQVWITKRRFSVDAVVEDSSEVTQLEGSDVSAYAAVLPEIVGAFEGSLNFTGALSSRSLTEGNEESDQWENSKKNLPFLWQHLVYTGYCLTIIVKNRDSVGARFFFDALVSWREHTKWIFRDMESLSSTLLLPGMINESWDSAQKMIGSFRFRHIGSNSVPRSLLGQVLTEQHRDYMLITAAMYLHWNMGKNKSFTTGLDITRSLLVMDVEDFYGEEVRLKKFDFREIVLRLLRFEISKELFPANAYSDEISRVIEMFDISSEEPRIAGRVCTSMKMSYIHDLYLPFLVFLLVAIPLRVRQDNVLVQMEKHLDWVMAGPNGYFALNSVSMAFGQWGKLLEDKENLIQEGVELLNTEVEFGEAKSALSRFLSQAGEKVSRRLNSYIRARPVDRSHLHTLRDKIESKFLEGFKDNFFLKNVPLVRRKSMSYTSLPLSLEHTPMGHFTDPPLEKDSEIFMEELSEQIKSDVPNLLLESYFSSKPEAEISLDVGLESPKFWESLVELEKKFTDLVVLAVSYESQDIVYNLIEDAEMNKEAVVPLIRLKDRWHHDEYLATFGKTDIVSLDLEQNEALLFSRADLRRIELIDTEELNHFVSVNFVTTNPTHGKLIINVYYEIHWSNEPLVKLRFQ